MNASVETRMIANVAYTFEKLEAMSGPGQVALFNMAVGDDESKHVKRFSDRKAGAKRLWELGTPIEIRRAEPVTKGHVREAIEHPAEEPAPVDAKAAKKSKAKPKAEAKPQGERKVRQMTFRLPPKGKTFKAHREGTCRARLIELLGRPNGALFSECQAEFNWDKKTCYEGIRLLNSLLGYGLFHQVQKNGEIRIWLVTSTEDFRRRCHEAKEAENSA